MASRVKRLEKIYRNIMESEQFGGAYSFGGDTDRILSDYPQLEPEEGILISAYLERAYTPMRFAIAIKRLGIK